MFNGSTVTVNGGNFNNSTTTTGTQHEADPLFRQCAPAALLDSSERLDPPRCHPRTRDAEIKEIMAWVKDSNPAASMMIVYGPAYSGKSALAQSVAEECKAQSLFAAGFFFSKTVPGRNNGHCLIPTIAFQLISSHPEVRLPVRMILWREPMLLKKSIQIVTEDLLIAPFFSWIFIGLCWITWAFGWVHPRLIVIDGLNECADHKIQSHILRAAATATRRLPRPFRILITFRSETNIMRTLREPVFNYEELDLGNRDASDGILLFLVDKFEEIKQNHPLAKHGKISTSWPGSDNIAKIAEKSSGQIIYAVVVISYIESVEHSPVERLNAILAPKPDDDNPLATLDALYKVVFSSVTTNTTLMRQILYAMVVPRPEGDGLARCTTPAMIAERLSPVSVESIFLILEQLRSIISFAGPDEPVKFWHASIYDFLLDETRSKDFFVGT